jgi:hypothetical protein
MTDTTRPINLGPEAVAAQLPSRGMRRTKACLDVNKFFEAVS